MRSVRSRKSWTASEVGGCLLPDLVLEDSPPFCKYGRMRKTWLKEAGITDVSAFFSLENEKELGSWSDRFAAVTAKSYMRGYRDIYKDVGLFHRLMIRFCDSLVKMKIVKIIFGA